MNKRIQELSEKANAWRPGGYPSGEGGDKAWKDVVIFEKDEDLQKFAELIVQECMNVLNDNELWNGHISNVLKAHFVVEK